MMDALQQLRERNEYLEETVAYLRRQMGIDADMAFIVRCREVFGMTKGQARLFRVMLTAHSASTEALHMALYSDRPDQPNIKIIGTIVCNLRPKLWRRGVEIETVWGQGYSLTPANKAKIEALLS